MSKRYGEGDLKLAGKCSEEYLCFSGMSDTCIAVTTSYTCKTLYVKKKKKKKKACFQRLYDRYSSFTLLALFNFGSNPMIQEI